MHETLETILESLNSRDYDSLEEAAEDMQSFVDDHEGTIIIRLAQSERGTIYRGWYT